MKARTEAETAQIDDEAVHVLPVQHVHRLQQPTQLLRSMHRGCNSPHGACVACTEAIAAHTASAASHMDAATAHIEAATVHTATVTAHTVPDTIKPPFCTYHDLP